MSDGGTGEGVSYWATINIRGKLDRDQLRAVLQEVRRVLGSKVGPSAPGTGNLPDVHHEEGSPVNGVIVQAARLANTTEPQVSVTLKVAPNKQATDR